MLQPERQYASGNSYRYGFNGKEGTGEITNEKYDFGSRIYDGKIGRWLSVDPLQKKYAGWSPYHFGYNSPIITIDHDGKENIIVVGGIDKTQGDPMKFINSGLRQLLNYSTSEPKEKTTMVIMTAHMTKSQVAQLNFIMSAYKGEKDAPYSNINWVFVSSGAELTNYMNSKDAKANKISEARLNDKITDVAFFGHGLPDKGFDAGYGAPAGSAIRENFNFNSEEIDKLDPSAFNNCKTTVYSCNSATIGSNKKSFVQEFADKTDGTATGWEEGQTNYANIYNKTNTDNLTNMDKIEVAIGIDSRRSDNLFSKQIRPANNLPTGGKDQKPDKVTYDKNGKEINRGKYPNN